MLRLVSATGKLLHNTKHNPYSRIDFKNSGPSSLHSSELKTLLKFTALPL
jgi:hypothetical protein